MSKQATKRATTWTTLVAVAQGSAAAQRGTGHRTAAMRQAADSRPAPMPRYVSEETAWDGLADYCVEQEKDEETDEWRYKHADALREDAPSGEFCARALSAMQTHQSRAERSPVLASTGMQATGKRHAKGRSDASVDDTVDESAERDLLTAEAREEMLACIDQLPGDLRRIAGMMMAGDGTASADAVGMPRTTWYRLRDKTREALLRIWRARGNWGATD